jgi:hypothetical protein
MASCNVPDIPLKQRVGATIGESAAFAKHSPAWIHGQVAIALAREEAERKGEPIDESKGKGLRSFKVGGRRLVLIDSLLEMMNLARFDLPDVAPAPAPKLAARGLPVAKARAAAAEADPLPPYADAQPQPGPPVRSLSPPRRRPPGRPRGGPDDLPPAA